MLYKYLLLNPYFNVNFTEFILLFIQRMWALLTGRLSLQQLATDEIQIFVLVSIAISSALVGTFLVLRRMTMLANSLSHTILIGIVLAYFFTMRQYTEETAAVPMQALLLASLAMGFITSFLTEFLTKTLRLQVDASTGLVFTSLFAVGVILVTLLTRSAHIGLEAVMGNADALHLDDLKWMAAIMLGNLVICFIFFKEYQITTFDPHLARALGFSNVFFNYLLMAQVSATAIGAFRAVGVFLVLAFMTGPILTARLFFNRHLNTLLLMSCFIGSMAAFIGVALTRHLLTVADIALSTAGMVVCMITAFYAIAILFAPQIGLIARWRFK